MSITYDERLVDTAAQKVRAYYGDTNKKAPILSDAEVSVAMASEDTTLVVGQLLAAATCADMCKAKFAVKVDRSGQGLTATRSQLFQHFRDLAVDLRERAERLNSTGVDITAGTAPLVGGVLDSTDETLASDDDYNEHAFSSRSQFDNVSSDG